MEFRFSVNEIFRQPVVKIGSNLLPPGFTGDRRAFWDVVGKVSEVVNAMGESSAAAQGLTKPITTAERLRNSEHNIYLLIDQNAANGRGAITGMLKTGKKGLYVFDRNGQHFQVTPPCVLDFYVHESRQRTGLGKRLFEHMLQEESIEPVKMAIDRPSDKFLGFLNKHYSLNNPVKQMNNYVVFDGFFPSTPEKNGAVEINHQSTLGKKQSANGLQTTSYASPLGRYGAPRPHCSMGQIIHNQSSTITKNTEPTGLGGTTRSLLTTNQQYAYPNSPGQPNVTYSTPNMYYPQYEKKMKLDGLEPNPMYQQNYGNIESQNVINYNQSQYVPQHPQQVFQNQQVQELPQNYPHVAQSMPTQNPTIVQNPEMQQYQQQAPNIPQYATTNAQNIQQFNNMPPQQYVGQATPQYQSQMLQSAQQPIHVASPQNQNLIAQNVSSLQATNQNALDSGAQYIAQNQNITPQNVPSMQMTNQRVPNNSTQYSSQNENIMPQNVPSMQVGSHNLPDGTVQYPMHVAETKQQIQNTGNVMNQNPAQYAYSQQHFNETPSASVTENKSMPQTQYQTQSLTNSQVQYAVANNQSNVNTNLDTQSNNYLAQNQMTNQVSQPNVTVTNPNINQTIKNQILSQPNLANQMNPEHYQNQNFASHQSAQMPQNITVTSNQTVPEPNPEIPTTMQHHNQMNFNSAQNRGEPASMPQANPESIQYQTINSQNHAYGDHLNKMDTINQQQFQNEQGNLKSDVMAAIRYGYPPQVSEPLKQAISSSILNSNG